MKSVPGMGRDIFIGTFGAPGKKDTPHIISEYFIKSANKAAQSDSTGPQTFFITMNV